MPYICQICKKQPATIHLTDIHNNIKKEVHICESCADEKGFNLQGTANLPQLLGLAAKKMIHVAAPAAQLQAMKPSEENPTCPKCGFTWAQFNERRRLGCPEDYHAFEAKLRQFVSSQDNPIGVNRDSFHVGKTPSHCREADNQDKILRRLTKRLKRAVAEENYEEAAVIKVELDQLRCEDVEKE